MTKLSDELGKLNVTLTVNYVELSDSDNWLHDKWLATICYQDRKYSTTYKTGMGHRVPARDAIRVGNKYYRSGPNATANLHVEEACRQGLLIPNKNIKVSDVVGCLLIDAASSDCVFEDWCSDLGYDTDSRKALDIYMSCQKIRSELIKLFGRETFSRLLELSSDF